MAGNIILVLVTATVMTQPRGQVQLIIANRKGHGLLKSTVLQKISSYTVFFSKAMAETIGSTSIDVEEAFGVI